MRLVKSLVCGPFISSYGWFSKIIAVILVVLLTLLTQLGGIILWISFGLRNCFENHKSLRLNTVWIFALLYSLSVLVIVPMTATHFGRVPLQCLTSENEPYEANSLLYCALMRNYVTPELKYTLERLTNHMAEKYPGTIVSYLDANFPFGDGFPMLPHLSHKDGKKLDLAFFYKDRATGELTEKGGGWSIGYWSFAPATAHQQTKACEVDGVLRWNFNWLQPVFSDLSLDIERTSEMLFFLSNDTSTQNVQSIFVEPYLKGVLNVHHEKIRFAGCNAARHDDHIHFQVQ